MHHLAETLRARLEELPGVAVRDLGVERSGIVAFDVAGVPADEVAASLGGRGVNVSVAPASYSRLDLRARGLEAIVRASPHIYNTDDELDVLVDHVAGLGGGRPRRLSPDR